MYSHITDRAGPANPDGCRTLRAVSAAIVKSGADPAQNLDDWLRVYHVAIPFNGTSESAKSSDAVITSLITADPFGFLFFSSRIKCVGAWLAVMPH